MGSHFFLSPQLLNWWCLAAFSLSSVGTSIVLLDTDLFSSPHTVLVLIVTSTPHFSPPDGSHFILANTPHSADRLTLMDLFQLTPAIGPGKFVDIIDVDGGVWDGRSAKVAECNY